MYSEMTSKQLSDIYDLLYARFGPQHWWPGDTPFEIIVGAILTQNTNWTNVVKAIANLKKEHLLTPTKLHALDTRKLASLIRPAGYFNIKAKRLKNFLNWFFENYSGQLKNLKSVPTDVLRRELLSVNGIGPETADSILLYALSRPVFVIDAYTKRICSRHYLIKKDADPVVSSPALSLSKGSNYYHRVQQLFELNLPSDLRLFNEYHALFVCLGKEICRPSPKCPLCPLNHLPHRTS
jgi:endonuclease-3 related protein